MKFKIIAVGEKLPAWVNAGVEEYTKRMPPEARVHLIEVKAEDRARRSVEQCMAAESERILAKVERDDTLIALDERGDQIITEQLAKWIETWAQEGAHPVFVIGGADGLDASVKARAAKLMGLSKLTLPHGLARVLLAEQLYRAWSLNKGHPYHRA